METKDIIYGQNNYGSVSLGLAKIITLKNNTLLFAIFFLRTGGVTSCLAAIGFNPQQAARDKEVNCIAEPVNPRSSLARRQILASSSSPAVFEYIHKSTSFGG